MSKDIDEKIDQVSGSETRNERTWAVATGAVGGYLAGPKGVFVGARVGASLGRGAQQVEKTVHSAADSIKRVFRW